MAAAQAPAVVPVAAAEVPAAVPVRAVPAAARITKPSLLPGERGFAQDQEDGSSTAGGIWFKGGTI